MDQPKRLSNWVNPEIAQKNGWRKIVGADESWTSTDREIKFHISPDFRGRWSSVLHFDIETIPDMSCQYVYWFEDDRDAVEFMLRYQ